eukprot:245144-Hanusia_phi.AAC.1
MRVSGPSGEASRLEGGEEEGMAVTCAFAVGGTNLQLHAGELSGLRENFLSRSERGDWGVSQQSLLRGSSSRCRGRRDMGKRSPESTRRTPAEKLLLLPFLLVYRLLSFLGGLFFSRSSLIVRTYRNVHVLVRVWGRAIRQERRGLALLGRSIPSTVALIPVSSSSSRFVRLSGRVRNMVRRAINVVRSRVYYEETVDEEEKDAPVSPELFGRRFRNEETLKEEAESTREALEWMRETVSKARVESWKQVYTLGGEKEVEKLMHDIDVFDGNSVSGSIANEYASEIKRAFEELELERNVTGTSANKKASKDVDEATIPLINLGAEFNDTEDFAVAKDWLYSGADPMTFSDFTDNEPVQEQARDEMGSRGPSMVDQEERDQQTFLKDLSWITSWLSSRTKSVEDLNEELRSAISAADYDKVKKALIQGADVDYRYDDGMNAVQVCEV